MKPRAMDVEALAKRLAQFGQEHLLRFWDALNDDERRRLYDDLETIDLEEMTTAFHKTMAQTTNADSDLDARMTPIEADLCAAVGELPDVRLEYLRSVALDAVSRSQMGVVCLAGGLGTRLGADYPKGMFDIGLPSRKTLFQLQIERIRCLENLAFEATGRRGKITLYIMTSEQTRFRTVNFLECNYYFGADPESVIVFEQRSIPCFESDGRIILSTPHKVARSPDGNGGLYWALKHDNILNDMQRRGTKYVHVYCVDNVLVKVADPLFMGYCINKGVESGNKVVEKTAPTEAVGVVCRVDGKVQVVEYSEINELTASMTNESGKLTYSAGNICNHFFTADFLKRVCDEHLYDLPYHAAKKKIPFVDETLRTVEPLKPNGIKMEKFVFDVFQFSASFAVWLGPREEEFSPLKNADGPGVSDTPTAARHALLALHKTYWARAGIAMTGDDAKQIEISPLASYSGENLNKRANELGLLVNLKLT